ncbi:synembryn-A [Galendromus occidentalis]|uniref:Synembryn-A n=1 Tax=Galendromus occidentalis TaxID=34638 RepID=A0AAJ7SEE2_9ACAR|nr:synembryn-A [Galendromus occidentalis]
MAENHAAMAESLPAGSVTAEGSTSLDWESGVKALKEFNETNVKTYTFDESQLREFLPQIPHVVKLLDSAAEEDRMVALATCRILSRDRKVANAVFGKDLFEKLCIITRLKTGSGPLTEALAPAALEAEKVISNLVFHEQEYRDLSVAHGVLKSLIDRVATVDAVSPEIQLFDVRVLFGLTAREPSLRLVARQELDGLANLCSLLKNLHDKLPESDADLINWTLRALYNLTASFKEEEKEELELDELMTILRQLLLAMKDDKLVVEEVINNLSNMSKKSLAGLLTPTISADSHRFMRYNVEAVDVMLDQLDYKLESPHQRECLVPVLVALSQAARSSRVIRKYVKARILPPLKDVMNRPEEGDTLRNKLVRLMTSPLTEVKCTAADLLFVLCKEKVGRLIKYTGYGNAAGLLANRGLMLGGRGNGHFSSESEDSDTEEYVKYKDNINPVLGCYEEPKPNPIDEMTEEQKEHEAMQLLQLINRLAQCSNIRPCVVYDGKPHPVDNVHELLNGLSQPNTSQTEGD